MKILELIQASLIKAGIDKKYAERVQKLFKIDKEENIDAFVDLFKENVLPSIQEAETAAKTAAEAEAKKKAIEEYEAAHKLKDGKPVENPPAEPGKIPETMDPAIKALIEKQSADIAALTNLVTGVVKTQTSGAKLADVKAKLKGKVDDKFIDRVAGKVNLDAEDLEKEIEAQVTEFNDFKQALINETVGGEYRQQQSQHNDKMEVGDWAKLMDGEGKTGTGIVDLGLGK